ncbi:MAG TPA: diguanylate cyclase [Candidatus Dormibacteraeota bacterium]
MSQAFRAVAILIVATLVLTGACFAAVLGHFEPSLSTLLAGRDAVDGANDGMLDEETGLRGYLDSGNQIFLTPYYLGRTEIAQGNANSTDLAANPALTGPIIAMRIAQQRWISEWATPALASGKAESGAAEVDTFLLQGKALFDTYRTANDLVNLDVDEDIVVQQEDEHDLVVVAFGLVAISLVITTVVARRQHRSLRLAVVEPIDDLVMTMRRVGSGDLTARPTSSGPPELREVAAELSRMTDTLVEERFRIASMEADARSQAERLGLIVSVGREISGSLSLRYVADAVSKAALIIGGFDAARMWLIDEARRELTVVHDSGDHVGSTEDRETVLLGEGLVGRAGQFGRTLATRSAGSLATEYTPGVPVAVIALPMIVGARIVGVLELTANEPVEIDATKLDVVHSLTGQAASAVEAARFHERADELSHTDVLTRLPNRRRLEVDLEAEVARSTRYNRPVAFIMLDVDHFKSVNDLHGHQAGDEVLSEFQSAFKASLRETDTAYRYGGEEFCVILRETDGDAAGVVAERLRSVIAQRFAGVGGSPMVTASLGIASMPDDAVDGPSLVAAADKAMYQAKASGRNCVVRAAAGPTVMNGSRVRVRSRLRAITTTRSGTTSPPAQDAGPPAALKVSD